METVLIAFIVITVLLFAALTLFQDYMSAQDTLRASWQEMEERLEKQTRTTISLINVETKSSGAVVELTLRNDGATRLSDFDQWDVILQHYTAASNYQINWLPYVDYEPVSDEWTVVGIYLDTAASVAEVYEPGIFNPSEEMLLRARISPSVGIGTTNMVTVSTDYGIRASTIFTR